MPAFYFGIGVTDTKSAAALATGRQRRHLRGEALNKLLGRPVVLPRPMLGLSVNKEVRAIQDESAMQTPTPATALLLFEATSNIPGEVKGSDPHIWNKRSANHWNCVVAEVALDPSVRRSVRNSGFHTRRHVTPSQVRLLQSDSVTPETRESIQQRISLLGFRPAFSDGEPVSTTITVHYHFREYTWEDQAAMLSLR